MSSQHAVLLAQIDFEYHVREVKSSGWDQARLDFFTSQLFDSGDSRKSTPLSGYQTHGFSLEVDLNTPTGRL